MPKYSYAVIQVDYNYPTEPDYYFNSSYDPEDLNWVAEEAAEHYFDFHDGWEADWPLIFAIFDENGKLLGSCEVEMENEPTFSATKIMS